jgi:hypothetical protein
VKGSYKVIFAIYLCTDFTTYLQNKSYEPLLDNILNYLAVHFVRFVLRLFQLSVPGVAMLLNLSSCSSIVTRLKKKKSTFQRICCSKYCTTLRGGFNALFLTSGLRRKYRQLDDSSKIHLWSNRKIFMLRGWCQPCQKNLRKP